MLWRKTEMNMTYVINCLGCFHEIMIFASTSPMPTIQNYTRPIRRYPCNLTRRNPPSGDTMGILAWVQARIAEHKEDYRKLSRVVVGQGARMPCIHLYE